MSIRIAVLGAGNMGGALIGGIVNRVTPADHVIATTRTPERAAELSAKYGIRRRPAAIAKPPRRPT